MTCLETSFLVDLLRGKAEVKDIKDELDRTEKVLTIAAPSIMELWSGASLSRTTALEKAKINELVSSLTILSLDENSAKEAGEMESQLLKAGLRIETEDIMIAAIARVNGQKLITRDQHYARIPGLKLLKY